MISAVHVAPIPAVGKGDVEAQRRVWRALGRSRGAGTASATRPGQRQRLVCRSVLISADHLQARADRRRPGRVDAGTAAVVGDSSQRLDRLAVAIEQCRRPVRGRVARLVTRRRGALPASRTCCRHRHHDCRRSGAGGWRRVHQGERSGRRRRCGTDGTRRRTVRARPAGRHHARRSRSGVVTSEHSHGEYRGHGGILRRPVVSLAGRLAGTVDGVDVDGEGDVGGRLSRCRRCVGHRLELRADGNVAVGNRPAAVPSRRRPAHWATFSAPSTSRPNPRPRTGRASRCRPAPRW